MSDKIKENLEVYVCLDVDSKRIDRTVILQCIKVCIMVNNPDYNISVFREIDDDIISSSDVKDVIQKGIYSLCKMFETLKLKTKDNVWFLYVASGYLKAMSDTDVTLLLLNKDPSVRECFYTLNKKAITVFHEQQRNKKLESIQVIKRSLEELCKTKKTIKYKSLSSQS